MKTSELTKSETQKYFASSNGGRGFETYFDKVFNNPEFQRIYILKGGPGTGKSSIMRSMCNIALELGALCEQVLCSSDPDSLDGVIIISDHGKLAILDGTAPHTRDTLTPGAIDEIIDLGRFWDSDELSMYRSVILDLQSKKQSAYANAYSILSSALEFLMRKTTILKNCLDTKKLEDAIVRLFGGKKHNDPIPHVSFKLNKAISAKGPFSCGLYENMYDRSIAVYGMHGASFAVFDEIRRYAQTRKFSVTLSPTPIWRDILDGISVDSCKISFYDAGKHKPDKSTKSINSERFLVEDRLREAKPTLRMLTKLYDDTMECAYKELAKTRTYHFALENIYTSAMKFDQMNIVREYLTERIKAFCT